MRISVDEAAYLLQTGKIVGVPTETVYGLAASLTCPDAINNIFALKNRPQSNPLIIHVASVEQITPHAKTLPLGFHELAEAFWPGPLTLVIPIDTETIAPQVRAGLATAAFRVPNHLLTQLLIEKTGPLAMPSANLSGRPSSTSPTHVEEDFGSGFPILDGGSCVKGLESTILYYQKDEWVIARLGALSAEAFQLVLGYKPSMIDKGTPQLCPGQFHRHYAPQAKLLVGKEIPSKDADCIIGFSDRSYPPGKPLITWGASTDVETVAANLYHVLRQLDKEGISTAWVDTDFPAEGLWTTIAERLHRAAMKM